MAVTVCVLGRVSMTVDGVDVPLPSGRPLWILTLLALAQGRPVSADALIVGMWGDDAPSTAARTLQVHVSTLRTRLRDSGVGVSLTPAGYALDVDRSVIDVVQFDHAAEQGLVALTAGDHETASRALGRAASLCGEQVLTNVTEAPFAAIEADRLLLRRVGVLQARLEADLALGLGATLVDELRAVVAANPFDERACGQLMVGLYRAGCPVDALAAFRTFRARLAEELGLEPGPALVDLERQVLVHDSRLLVSPGVAGRRHNLPEEVSSFIGRGRELELLSGELRRRRLVTLIGAGGVGKTRLAIRLATDVVDRFSDGAWFAELASVGDAALVTAALVEAVGSGRVDDGTDGLVEAIGKRSMLIVIDNCEHVVDDVARLAERLLRRCPNLRLAATSREPLSIEGEFVYRVPPLSLTDGEGSGDSLLLFADRAATQRPGFALDSSTVDLVSKICARLDGLPLGIELAAAQLRSLSLNQLTHYLDERLERLTGANRRSTARQQTLRGVIDWSYDRLADDEQLLLDQLSVFVGGFTIEAAQAVASSGRPNRDEFVVFMSVVDKCLVEPDPSDPDRYRLLETIREYAGQRLAGRPPAVTHATRSAHADHYLMIAEAAAAAIDLGPGQHDALRRLDREHDNIRAAFAELRVQGGHLDSALRMANAMRLYWSIRGHCHEGLAITRQLLDESAEQFTPEHVLALCTAADLADATGDTASSGELVETAREYAARLCRPDLVARVEQAAALALARSGHAQQALDVLAPFDPAVLDAPLASGLQLVRGYALRKIGRVAEARTALQSVRAIAEEAGNDARRAIALINLSSIDMASGDLGEAQRNLDEAYEVAVRLRDYGNLAFITLNLGLLALCREDVPSAWIRYRESLLLSRDTAELSAISAACLGTAICIAHLGDATTAAVLHGFVDVASDDGADLDLTENALRRAARSELGARIEPDDLYRLVARGSRLSASAAIDLALAALPDDAIGQGSVT